MLIYVSVSLNLLSFSISLRVVMGIFILLLSAFQSMEPLENALNLLLKSTCYNTISMKITLNSNVYTYLISGAKSHDGLEIPLCLTTPYFFDRKAYFCLCHVQQWIVTIYFVSDFIYAKGEEFHS